jgi:diacylglycerol O-acyltransferase
VDRLSGLDASFLYLETPEQLMHVCGLILLDPTTVPGGYSFDRLQDQLGQRVAEIPTFTRKLRRVPLGLDFPVWQRDDHFDVQRHLHRMAVPAPGGELCRRPAGSASWPRSLGTWPGFRSTVRVRCGRCG